LTALKLRRFGNSVGVILPKEELAAMGVKEGDTIYLTRAPGGSRITRHDPDFERTMEAARKVMRERYDALRELAK
jgi:putative addiction module antidote